jgi:AraC family transcriptional regulator of arabinose operon
LDDLIDMADIRRAAWALYQMILEEPVDEGLRADAAAYFATTDSPVDPATFDTWFQSVRRNLDRQPDLSSLGRRWRQRLAGRREFSAEEAEAFHREYVAALQMDGLVSQAVVGGYSKRSAGSAFDYELTQPDRATAWVLLFTVEGRAQLRVGIRETSVEPGDALLFSPGAVYGIRRSPERDDWSHYWIVFQPLSRWRRYLDWPEVGPDAFRLKARRSARASIVDALDRLLAACAEPSPLKVELEANLLEHLLLRCASLRTDVRPAAADDRIKRAQRFIEDHFNEDFSLQQVADAAHLSSSRLTSLFRDQTGLSVFGWRDEKRLVEAAQLLRGTDLAIAEIGRRIGIADAAYFSRLFRRYVGSSPRAYRRGERQGLPTD